MYKLIACWSAPRGEDIDEFEKHYEEVHAPAAAAVPNLRRLVLTVTANGLEGGESAFYRVAEMHFDSRENLEASEQSAEWTAMRQDAGHMIEHFGVTLEVGVGTEFEAKVPKA